METRRSHRLLWGLLWLAAAQFVVLTVVAMVAYPGGSEFDPDARRYHFWTNTLSDLGRTETRSGADNTEAAGVYHVSLAILAAGLAAGWWVLGTLMPAHRRCRALMRACGLLSVAGAVGVALTPADVLPVWHGVTIGIASVPGLTALVALVSGAWADRASPRWVAVWASAVLVSAGVHFLQYVRHYWLGGPWTPAAPAVQKVFAATGVGFVLAVSQWRWIRLGLRRGLG